MDIQELRRNIVSECLDENGFLVLLHSYVTFDEEKYRSLINKISAYAELLGDSDKIDRDVAACLFELMMAISTAANQFSQIDHPDVSKVIDAFREVSTLLHLQIFTL
jgi:hypothetical protein